MSRVLLSQMLSPEEEARVCKLLRNFQPTTQFTKDEAADAIIRIATKTEIMMPATATECVFSVTPFCLSQMLEANIDPFRFRPKGSQSLVNIFLIGKVFAVVSFPPADTKRLISMIRQMCGGVADDTKSVNYVISPKLIECGATAVHPSWIDALITSHSFIEPTEFPWKKAPPKSISALSQRPPSRGPRGGRLVLVREPSQTSLPFPPRSGPASQPPRLKRSVSRPREPVPGVLSLDVFFPSPHSQTVAERPDTGTQITIRAIDCEIAKPALRRVATQASMLAAADEELSDDAVPAREPGPPADLDVLCQRLLRAQSRAHGSEAGDPRSQIQELQIFSQVDEEQKPGVVFDVAYEREPPAEPAPGARAEDPLINVLANC